MNKNNIIIYLHTRFFFLYYILNNIFNNKCILHNGEN